MTRAFLIGTSMALSIFLAGCGKDAATEDAPKEWRAYEPPVATGSLAGSGSLTTSGAVLPTTGTGSVAPK